MEYHLCRGDIHGDAMCGHARAFATHPPAELQSRDSPRGRRIPLFPSALAHLAPRPATDLPSPLSSSPVRTIHARASASPPNARACGALDGLKPVRSATSIPPWASAPGLRVARSHGVLHRAEVLSDLAGCSARHAAPCPAGMASTMRISARHSTSWTLTRPAREAHAER